MSECYMSDNQKTASPYRYDRVLIAAIVAILVLGLVMVASASVVVSQKQFGTPFHFLFRQMCFLLVALLLSSQLLKVNMKTIAKYSPMVFMLTIFLLLLVLIPHVGRNINGSQRWLNLGLFGLQVSELAKITMILYLSGYLVRRSEEVRTRMSGFIKPMFVLSLVCFLLLREPDFGASVVIILTTMGMLFLAEMRLRYFMGLIALVVGVMALLALASPYRMQRVIGFLNPWEHAFSSGYQLTQSLIAFGNGGFFGVGLGNSVQKLFYLPESYTDFLFAVLSEEFGLFGIIVVFGLYITIVLKALFIGNRARLRHDPYSVFCAYGIGLWLGLQFLINVGVNAGVLPTKGLTLPLMSYGGSSLVIDCLALALLIRIDYENRCHFRQSYCSTITVG